MAMASECLICFVGGLSVENTFSYLAFQVYAFLLEEVGAPLEIPSTIVRISPRGYHCRLGFSEACSEYPFNPLCHFGLDGWPWSIECWGIRCFNSPLPFISSSFFLEGVAIFILMAFYLIVGTKVATSSVVVVSAWFVFSLHIQIGVVHLGPCPLDGVLLSPPVMLVLLRPLHGFGKAWSIGTPLCLLQLDLPWGCQGLRVSLALMKLFALSNVIFSSWSSVLYWTMPSMPLYFRSPIVWCSGGTLQATSSSCSL